MVGGQIDMAVEEIRVVVDDLLHCPSGCSNCSVRTTKGRHLGLIIDEDPAGLANALLSIRGLSQNCCSSLSDLALSLLCIASQVRTLVDDCL
ncbi:unnamed protein product [Haemonchus placei]|uniref:DUF3475 domain-containing protein n=1 Tax=Haemonchus placei TaxID=6290 RepID=A0A0N4X0J2_HAEPC|nr:unnamed protein product [Haemonchus placei]